MAEPDPSGRSESWSQMPKKDPLLIKLKISKTEQGGEPSEPEEPSSPAAARLCEFCGKGFMNGKALGGHIRIHNQEKNRASSSKKMDESRLMKQKAKSEKHLHADLPAPEKGRDFDCAEKEEETPCCYICDRNFPSMKSLFGHMRFHPERNWRGVQPPAQEKDGSCTREVESVNQTTDQDSACLEARSSRCVADLLKGLPSWSRTDKRGRKSLVASEPEAIDGLMKLACAASYDSGISDDQVHGESPPRKRKLNDEEIPVPRNQNPEPTGSRIQQSTSIEGEGSFKAVCNQDYELKHADRPRKYRKEERCGHNLESNPNMDADKKIKESGMCKTRDLSTNKEVAAVQVKEEDKILTHYRFKCMTCGKTFPTFQALGGHRSSHNKERGIVQPPEASLSTGASGTEKKIAPSPKIHIAGTNNCTTSSAQEDYMTHRCEICRKKFPTGQALGGHKRCHWARQTEGPPSSEVVSPGDQASQSGPRTLAFDLNEPPPMDEEDGIISGFNRA
ncbi:hypothetical protein BT93_J0434 [Corymbia citriodora subsp. variegata]|nr:hypothetical protein BT93_J0434 [Corymbia citriodora subsp. variegata]